MIEHVVVVVPAKDEQDEIAVCLDALRFACEALETASSGATGSDIVVVLDDCHDATAEIVAAHGVRAVHSDAGRVGTARRLGVHSALAAVEGTRLDATWIASTDADCVVPVDWLVRMVASANAGADLTLGTVSPGAGLATGLRSAWTAAHELGQDHPHVHAANLGVRASRYVELGGWRDLACHEDHELVARAVSAGLPVARLGDFAVRTSSRLVSRVLDGFAGYLRDLTPQPADNAIPVSTPLGT